MLTVVYAVIVLVIALVDSALKGSAIYLPLNLALRVLVLLPLIFSIVQGKSTYARWMRATLWMVMVADILLPIFFPAGMMAFLIVHLLNAYNFLQHIEVRSARVGSLALPAVFAFGTALFLYKVFLFPTMDTFFRVLVAVYLVPIALALSLATTCAVQRRSRWAITAAAGMLLFFCTDFQVAVEFLTPASIPAYGVINALTYYAALFLMSVPTQRQAAM